MQQALAWIYVEFKKRNEQAIGLEKRCSELRAQIEEETTKLNRDWGTKLELMTAQSKARGLRINELEV